MDYYDILGVSPAASTRDIDRAFQQKSKETNDIQQMLEIGMAHRILVDPATRDVYDMGRNAPRVQAPSLTPAAPVFPPPPQYDQFMIPQSKQQEVIQGLTGIFVWTILAGATVVVAFIIALVGGG
jgi:hypothetical protein